MNYLGASPYVSVRQSGNMRSDAAFPHPYSAHPNSVAICFLSRGRLPAARSKVRDHAALAPLAVAVTFSNPSQNRERRWLVTERTQLHAQAPSDHCGTLRPLLRAPLLFWRWHGLSVKNSVSLSPAGFSADAAH